MTSTSQRMNSDGRLIPLGDFSAMVTAIARAAGIADEEAERRLRLEFDGLGNNVRDDLAGYGVTPFLWTDRLAEFYANTRAFLFESLTWNDMPSKQAMRSWIVDYLRREGRRSQNVICCGDGLGFDSATLALAGHQTTYFEVSNECRKFAAEVFTTNRAQVRMIDSLDSPASESFDVVVCLDVLEHVPQPESFTAKLARLVKPGGLLIAHAPFWLLDEATPTHLRDNLRYSGDWRSLYGVHGLKPIAGRYFWNPLVLHKPDGAAKRPLAPRIVPALGGVFLKCQRVWAWPFRTIVRGVLRAEQNKRRKTLLSGAKAAD